MPAKTKKTNKSNPDIVFRSVDEYIKYYEELSKRPAPKKNKYYELGASAASNAIQRVASQLTSG